MVSESSVEILEDSQLLYVCKILPRWDKFSYICHVYKAVKGVLYVEHTAWHH